MMLRPVHEGKTIYFALAVKTGAAAENDSEHGIAHFVEHMAFNGTERFSSNQIINLMQASGVQFGPELNAFTSYNYTCYYFCIPANKPELLTQAIQILQQWTSAIRFDHSEVEKEKKVVIEEIRKKSETTKTLHSFYANGTRFENHPIIGTAKDVSRITAPKLINFYRRWYQPHNMTLIAVGGFDEVQLSKAIKKTFGSRVSRTTRVLKPWEDIPSADKRVLPIIDSYDGQTYIKMAWAHRSRPVTNMPALKKEMLKDFVTTLIQHRLSQTISTADPPIYSVNLNSTQINPKTKLQQIRITVKNDGHIDGVESLWSELLKIRSHGFSTKEIEIAKQIKKYEIDSENDTIYLKTEMFRLLHSNIRETQLVHPYIYGLLYRRYLKTFTADSVHRVFNTLFGTDPNFIVLGLQDETDEKRLSSDVVEAITKLNQFQVQSHQVDTSTQSLVMPQVEPGHIIATENIDFFGVLNIERLQLNNGVSFYIKEIADQNLISFCFSAPGGKNVLSDDQLPSAHFLPKFMQYAVIEGQSLESGKSNLSARGIKIRIFVNENLHGIEGTFPKNQCDYLFGFIHLLISKSTIDQDRFENVQQQLFDSRRRIDAISKDKLSLDIKRTIYKADQRRYPVSANQLTNVTSADVLSAYRKLFGNANGFHFLYMGDKYHLDLKKYITTYLATLPHLSKPQQHVRHSAQMLRHNKTITSSENRSKRSDIRLVYLIKGHDQTHRDRLTVQAMIYILEARLERVIREEHSLVYSVQVNKTTSRFPSEDWQLAIRYSCAPNNRERIADIIQEELKVLRNAGPQDQELYGAKNHLRHQSAYLDNNIRFIKSLFENRFIHTSFDIDGLKHQNMIENITHSDISQMAGICFGDTIIRVLAELNPSDP